MKEQNCKLGYLCLENESLKGEIKSKLKMQKTRKDLSEEGSVMVLKHDYKPK